MVVFSVKAGFGEASFDLRRVCSSSQAARRPLSVFIIISKIDRKKPSPNPQTGRLMLETMQTIPTKPDKTIFKDFRNSVTGIVSIVGIFLYCSQRSEAGGHV